MCMYTYMCTFVQAQERIICFGIDDGNEKVVWERAKNRWGAGAMRMTNRSSRSLYLGRVCVSLLSVPVFQAATLPFDIFVWQAGIAHPAKKARADRVDARPCFTTANRERVFSAMTACGSKNVSRRGRLNFRKIQPSLVTVPVIRDVRRAS